MLHPKHSAHHWHPVGGFQRSNLPDTFVLKRRVPILLVVDYTKTSPSTVENFISKKDDKAGGLARYQCRATFWGKPQIA